MNIKGNYLPLVGRFSGQGDGRDDILWLGQDVEYTSDHRPAGLAVGGPHQRGLHGHQPHDPDRLAAR